MQLDRYILQEMKFEWNRTYIRVILTNFLMFLRYILDTYLHVAVSGYLVLQVNHLSFGLEPLQFTPQLGMAWDT